MFKDKIIIKGAKAHNLKNINLDVPLNKIVAVSGVSGSGKTSLALGVLYAEGSRRYLEALSTYTRRRISQSKKAQVESIEHVPAALALHQRPNVPNIRSTFGTSTELLNSLRLLYSRCGNYICPNGHILPPSLNVAREIPLVCPECGEEFYGLGAEEYAFNSDGACPECDGTGYIRDVDEEKLVPDENKTLEEGAVQAWNLFGISWMYRVAGELGVRVNVPFKDLTEEEKEIVYHGPTVKKFIAIPSKNGKMFDLNAEYRNANKAIQEQLKNTTSEKGLDKINKFLKVKVCPECHGARINKRANSTLIMDKNLTQACEMTLTEIIDWLRKVPETMPNEMKDMSKNIIEEFMLNVNSLMSLGLEYLSLNRESNTLSTGELQRVQLARTVRNRTTGVLYVLDEPSIGLHPYNVDGLIEIFKQLVEDGNSVVFIDHDVRILNKADYMIELGPVAGSNGGYLISQGTIEEVKEDENSIISKYLSYKENLITRPKISKKELFDKGALKLSTNHIHTVKPLNLNIPKGRLTVVTGVSGSGKTTAILESLYPAIKNSINKEPLPEHVKSLDTAGIDKINLIDATPIGKNVRSTVATYSGVLNDLRKLYSNLNVSKEKNLKTNDFSYNTGKLRCETCNGTGRISMDVQFLPDVEITCPDCDGLRYNKQVEDIQYNNLSIKDLMGLTISDALKELESVKKVKNKLEILDNLGLGYLTLGESTPSLSGGEAQRLKLASDIDKKQDNSLFIFDEPTIGLHPDDVKVLIKVFQKLIDNGATIIIIEHDLDLIKNADYIIDMGPGGGLNGGEIIASGTLEDIKDNNISITGKYL